MSTPAGAWGTGRLRGGRGQPRLLFGRMYEDAAIERAAFAGLGRIFCIASAGDTAMALAQEHDVAACDLNSAQVAYAERRAAGAPAEEGEAERILRGLRALLPLAGWRAGVLRKFLELDDTGAQREYWHRHLDTRRWRWGCAAALSRRGLRAFYSSELVAALPGDFGVQLRRRLEAGFARHPNASNPYARALLLGEAPAVRRPPPGRIRFAVSDAAAWLEAAPAGSVDGFTLSNVLDGASAPYRKRLAEAVRRAASPRALVVVRSFAAWPAAVARNLAEQDRSFLWATVAVGEAMEFGGGEPR